MPISAACGSFGSWPISSMKSSGYVFAFATIGASIASSPSLVVRQAWVSSTAFVKKGDPAVQLLSRAIPCIVTSTRLVVFPKTSGSKDDERALAVPVVDRLQELRVNGSAPIVIGCSCRPRWHRRESLGHGRGLVSRSLRPGRAYPARKPQDRLSFRPFRRRTASERLRARIDSEWKIFSSRTVIRARQRASLNVRKRVSYADPFQTRLVCQVGAEGGQVSAAR